MLKLTKKEKQLLHDEYIMYYDLIANGKYFFAGEVSFYIQGILKAFVISHRITIEAQTILMEELERRY